MRLMLFSTLLLAFGLVGAKSLRAQGAASMGTSGPASPSNPLTSYIGSSLEVHVRGADGRPVPKQTVVQLIGLDSRLYEQLPVDNGIALFSRVSKSQYRLLVIAPGYQRAEKTVDFTTGTQQQKIAFDLQPMSDAEDAAADRAIGALNPKAQKEVGKALDALRKRKPSDAYSHLDVAQRQAPKSAEVEYLLGIYYTQVNDSAQAQEHWKKTLEYDPTHLSALLELAQTSLNQKKPANAIFYLDKALAIAPSSWRAYAFLAEADYLQSNREDALKHARRAVELGHDKAAAIEPFLAGLLAESGEKEQAVLILVDYVKANPFNVAAAKQLQQLQHPQPTSSTALGPSLNFNPATLELPIHANWLPADVDDHVPPVESGAVCSLDDVLPKTSDHVVALIHDVERFSATESVTDESINKWGVPSPWEKRKFDYVVSMQEIRPGHLSVDEYRTSGGFPAAFPDGFITNGLPALVMIFHPFYVSNYDMTCEGLARRSTGLAWQIHFRQKPDKPVENRGFRLGMRGSANPVPLKGRAWISADSYQIVRLETDLVEPQPQLHLLAEHTAVEYRSVIFQNSNVKLWVPQTAEVYFDWMGQRIHRTHAFSNYMLFSIDEQERIGSPKNQHPPDQPASEDKTGSARSPAE